MPKYSLFEKAVERVIKGKKTKLKKLLIKRYRFEIPARGKTISKDTVTKLSKAYKFIGTIEASKKSDVTRNAYRSGLLKEVYV